MKLKTLSLWQPHANLCVTPSFENPELPAKPIETRHWKTEHRGWLGIHSTMKKDPIYRDLCERPEFKQYIPRFDNLLFGYILGMVEISGCHSTNELHTSELNLIGDHPLMKFATGVCEDSGTRLKEILSFGNFEPNRYGFTISDFSAFAKPIKASGYQGFWYYDNPGNLSARVALHPFEPESPTGCVIDYDPDKLHKYKVKHDDGAIDWYGDEGIELMPEVNESSHPSDRLGVNLFSKDL